MLYTRKGDSGTTKTFACGERISKGSAITEALGALDEINSYLGLCKVKTRKEKLLAPKNLKVDQLIHDIQKNLFIVQAELAGASMHIDEEKLKEAEAIVDSIEKELPPIKKFFISGGTELSALFDIARTISRRAERRVIKAIEEDKVSVSKFSLAYLNRLSSVLYAFVRLANHRSGMTEQSPDYK